MLTVQFSCHLRRGESWGGDCIWREANRSQTCFSSGLFSTSSHRLGYVLDREAKLWLWGRAGLSYKLLLFMAMCPGPVCISIGFPAPCPPAPVPGIPHTTVLGAPADLGPAPLWFTSSSRSCSLLLSGSPFLSVLERMSVSSNRLRPLVGRNHVDCVVVISIPVFPAWPYPVGHVTVR